MSKSTKPKTLYIPRGTFEWPQILEPDFKYKKEFGEYRVKTHVPAEHPSVSEINETIQEALADFRAAQLEKLEKELDDATDGKTKKNIKALMALLDDDPYVPYGPATNDEGDDDESVIVYTCKAPGSYKDRKTGKTKKVTIGIVDAKGKPFAPDSVWGGTEGIVAVVLRPFLTPKGWGIKLGLKAVQILKLVEAGEGGSGVAFEEQDGFSAEGYESSQEDEDEKPSKGRKAPADADEDDGDEGDDF